MDEFNITESDLNILRTLGKYFINKAYGNSSFNLDDISMHLSKLDEEYLGNFIEKSLNADIIEVKSDDEFIFTNDLFPIYFSII